MRTMRYIFATALLLVVAACSNDEDFNSAYMNDPDAVRINATVGEGIPITRSNPIGTEEEQAKFNLADKIAVAAGRQNGVIYQYDGAAWNPATTGEYLKWETTAMDFKAYYPVRDGVSMEEFTLPTDQSMLEKLIAADYMTCFATDVAKADNVSLTLQRKTARVVVNTSFKNQFETGYTVTAISVGSNATGYTGGVAAGDPVSVNSYKHTDAAFYALIIPTVANGSADFMTITVTKAGDNTTQNLTVKAIPALDAGKSYTYNVIVGKDKVELGEVKVEDWTTGGIITGGEADELPFQDANFISALTASPYNIPLTGGIINPKVPATKAAIEAVTTLDVNSKQIQSLKGIEHFINLTELRCYDNQLTTLDVSGLSSLKRLYCHRNQLTTLDVSKLSSLTYLACADNLLTTLNVSGLSNLTTLDCQNNQLSTLDLSRLSELTYFDCNSNALTTLDVSGVSKLQTLYCAANAFTTLDFSGLSSLTTLWCSENQLPTLDVSGLSNLTKLDCHSQTDADGVAQQLTLTLTQAQATANLGKYATVTYYIPFSDANFVSALTTEYNIPHTNGIINPTDAATKAAIAAVTKLNVSIEQIKSLNGIEYFTNLTHLDCSENQLTTLDVSGLSNLTHLYCHYNQLTTLDFSGLSNLTTLFCNSNALTTLDVSGLSSLTTLWCDTNALTTLDVSMLSSLTTLYCHSQKTAGGAAQQLMLSLTQAQAAANLGSHASVDYDIVP